SASGSVTALVPTSGFTSDLGQVTTQSLAPRVNGPGYGMNIFIWDSPDTTDRDLAKVSDAHFGWQKSLFQWKRIEAKRGVFAWSEADRVVDASMNAGVKVI